MLNVEVPTTAVTMALALSGFGNHFDCGADDSSSSSKCATPSGHCQSSGEKDNFRSTNHTSSLSCFASAKP